MTDRIFTVYDVRLVDGEQNVIEGYGALYNSRSVPELGFVETIMTGAFAEADLSDVRMLWNHNSDMVLARTKSGTLTVAADERGLHYRGNVADTSYGKDALISVGRRDVDQNSFGFGQLSKGDDEWGIDDRGDVFRNIHRFRKVIDVSPTAFPAYPDAGINKRFDKRALAEIRDMLLKPKRDIERIDAMIKVHKILTTL